MLARYAIYASVRRARDLEGWPRRSSFPTPFAFALAKLPPDMNRLILEFKLGVVAPPQSPHPVASVLVPFSPSTSLPNKLKP